MKEKTYITFEEAMSQGYKYFFTPNRDIVNDLEKEELKDLKGIYESVELATKDFDSISLDPVGIIESACDDLWEEAAEQAMQDPIFKEFTDLCFRMNKELESVTASYGYSGVWIKINSL